MCLVADPHICLRTAVLLVLSHRVSLSMALTHNDNLPAKINCRPLSSGGVGLSSAAIGLTLALLDGEVAEPPYRCTLPRRPNARRSGSIHRRFDPCAPFELQTFKHTRTNRSPLSRDLKVALLLNIARGYSAQGDYATSVKACGAALAANPSCAKALYLRGKALVTPASAGAFETEEAIR